MNEDYTPYDNDDLQNEQSSRPVSEPTYDYQPPVKKPRKKHTALGIVALALCCALIGSVGGGAVVGYVLREESTPAQNVQPETTTGNATEAPTQQPTTQVTNVASNGTTLTPAQVYQNNVPAIVGIANESTAYNYFGQPSSTASSGTGFVISADGEILTNYHVVKGAETLTVTLSDGTQYPATVLGYEEASDVALLKIEATGLPTVTLGDSDSLSVGTEVAAIGNPLGELTYSLTVGYVSAKDRAINTDGTPINMMQIDAAINPGNSGGPLFDMSGNVVGITTAKYSGSTSNGATIEGIGFAIPINDVKDILDDLRENGAVLNRAYIGIRTDDVSDEAVESYGLPHGAVVASVEKDGSGYKAGLQKSDIITAIDDTQVTGISDLSTALKKYRAGDSAELTVYRSGETLKLTIVFDAKPTDSQTETTQPEQSTEQQTDGFPDIWDFLP